MNKASSKKYFLPGIYHERKSHKNRNKPYKKAYEFLYHRLNSVNGFEKNKMAAIYSLKKSYLENLELLRAMYETTAYIKNFFHSYESIMREGKDNLDYQVLYNYTVILDSPDVLNMLNSLYNTNNNAAFKEGWNYSGRITNLKPYHPDNCSRQIYGSAVSFDLVRYNTIIHVVAPVEAFTEELQENDLILTKINLEPFSYQNEQYYEASQYIVKCGEDILDISLMRW